MKTINKEMKKLLMVLFTGLVLSSCYDDYVEDFDYSTVGFAMAKPYRTVIADRDMELRLGVSIGGKRAVDMNDWATFKIDTASVPSGKTLLPRDYFTLSDSTTMRVHKSNLPVADIGIRFTDAFYADAASISGKYVLPLRITGSSLDSVYQDSTVVCFKYISTFHGTYYVKGKLIELDAPAGNEIDTVVYEDKDLIKNLTRDVSTLDRHTVVRAGVGNFTVAGNEKVQMKIVPDGNASKTYSIEVTTAPSGIAISNGSGMYYGNKDNPEITLEYAFVKGGKNYRVEETLILRQDPLYDLRVETW